MIFLIFINFFIYFFLQRFLVQTPARLNFFRPFFRKCRSCIFNCYDLLYVIFSLSRSSNIWNSFEPRVNLQSVFSYNPFSSHPSKRLTNYDVIERISFFSVGLTPLFVVMLLRRKVTLKRKTLDCSQSIVSSLGCPESYSTQFFFITIFVFNIFEKTCPIIL